MAPFPASPLRLLLLLLPGLAAAAGGPGDGGATPATPAAPTAATVAPRHFLGHGDDDATLERLCKQSIAKLTYNPHGTTIKFKVTLEDGLRGSLRPAQENDAGYHRADVAAYWLSRRLGYGAVPPSCLRIVTRQQILDAATDDKMRARLEKEIRWQGDTVQASVVAWVDNTWPAKLDETRKSWQKLLAQDTPLPTTGDEERGAALEGSRLLAWDYLIANWDRWSGSNTFRVGRKGPMVAVWLDNAAGFGRYSPAMRRRNEAQLDGIERFSRAQVAAMRALTDGDLAAALAPAALNKRELAQLTERRTALLQRIDALITKHGDPAVLCFE